MRNLGLLVLLSAGIAHAGVVGDFRHTRNLPGYIDLNPNSRTFQGPFTRDVNYGDGVILDTPSELISKYMVAGRIDTQKIQTLISEIEHYRTNARIAYCQVEMAEDKLTQAGCKEGNLGEKFANKWDKKDLNVALKYAVKRLREAIQYAPSVAPHNINMPDSQNFLEAFFDALEIYQGVVQEDSQVGRYEGLGDALRPVREILKHNTIQKGRIESANLTKSINGGQVFYSPEELAQMDENGEDISLLDPLDSGFWRAPKNLISAYNTTNYQNEEIPYFKKEITDTEIKRLMDPKIPVEMSYKIVMPRGSGETPKIVAKYGKSEFKIKFTTDRMGARKTSVVMHELMKVARDMEVNVETVANNLASAIGFTVDGTYYKDIVKLYFEKDIYEKGEFDSEYARMVEILDTHYGHIYNTASALKNIKIDSSGKKYIELKHVSLERKTDLETDMNIGSFVRKGLGKSLKREHRAFAVFLAWVWDTNTKDANNALKLIPYTDNSGQLRYKLAFSNSDMGSTLGSNRPNLYNFKLINTLTKDANGNPEYLRFNFWRVYPLDIMEAVTFADAKWIARLIGQLTPEQIYNANRAAGFTHVIAKYYTALMINKRNALIDALGLMNTKVQSNSGAPVVLKKLEGFTGSLEGYEEFFENGYLTDPENKLTDPAVDPFPRFWGAGITNRHIEGEPQAYFIKLLKFKIMTTIGNFIYKATLRGTNLNQHGQVGFREMNLDDISLAAACAQKCFFHGMQFGVEGFVPWRFLIDNPDPDAEAPFLLVDLYRLGFFAGANLQQFFGAAIPGELSLGIGAKHYQVAEYIKLRPIMDIEDFFDRKMDLLKMPKLHFQSARAQTIASLEKGEMLIQTHYVGLRAEATLKPAFMGSMMPFVPSVTFQGNAVKANRVTFLGQGDSKLLVGWDKFKELIGRARLNVFDFIIKVSVMETKLRKLQSLQRTFSFDLNKEEDKDVLFGNLNELLPDEVPGQYVLASRTTHLRERSFSLGFFRLFRREAFRRKIHVEYNDFEKDFTSSNFTYVRELAKTRLTRLLGSHTSNYKVQASVNTSNEVYAKIKLTGAFQNMNKWKFQHMLDKYTPLLPDNFIQFDPNAVLDNFGVLDLNIETIFSDKALRKIFEDQMTKFRMCGIYSEVHKLDWTNEDCEYLSERRLALPGFLSSGLDIDKKRFVRIWPKYKDARENFWKITNMEKSVSNTKKINAALKKIVEMMHDTGDFDYQSMKLFLAMAGNDNYYRRASMYSSLDAFPGKQDLISQDSTVSGGFGPSESMLSDSPQDEFEMFTDRVHKGLTGIFYNEMVLSATSVN
ncbi:MAG TPA: hypothetical protein VNJ08_04745 [Bacteriovoracaceae bacterium]|nr:hypothetical protein [Bacteriovoracaceae bacterium]